MRESLPTSCAFKGFLPRVSKFVLVQVTRLRESFIALQTSIWLHPGMQSFVYFEFLKFCEIFATLLAGEVHAGRWLVVDWGDWGEALELERVIHAF